MIDFLSKNWQYLVTASIPFFLWITRKEIKDELKKFQNSRTIEHMDSLYEYVFLLIVDASKVVAEKNLQESILNFQKEIMKYGSNEALNIFSVYMVKTYNDEATGKLGIYLFALLASQLRFDATGDWVMPTRFLEIRLSDLDKNDAKIEINRLILKNKFNKRMMIK